MCLTIKSDAKICEAEKNIICFKRGMIKWGGFNPFYQYSFEYFQSKQTKKVELTLRSRWDGASSAEIDEGYHSYPEISNWKVGKCNGVFIIPKGTKYYKGLDNDSEITAYVSESLIYVGSIKNPLTWLKIIFKYSQWEITKK